MRYKQPPQLKKLLDGSQFYFHSFQKIMERLSSNDSSFTSWIVLVINNYSSASIKALNGHLSSLCLVLGYSKYNKLCQYARYKTKSDQLITKHIDRRTASITYPTTIITSPILRFQEGMKAVVQRLESGYIKSVTNYSKLIDYSETIRLKSIHLILTQMIHNNKANDISGTSLS